MFIASKRNIILPSPDGKRHCRVSRDYVGEIPDWAAETDYFCALVKDGKISVPESHSDADVEKAGKRGRRGRKGQENGESSGEAETGKSKTGEAETNEAE